MSTLFDLAPREMADTSLEAYAKIRPTLGEREWKVFEALWRYCDQTGWHDATGMELANFLGTWPTSTRPRLTNLLAKGLVQKTDIRRSRTTSEGRCHGYRPVVPLDAVARGRKRGK